MTCKHQASIHIRKRNYQALIIEHSLIHHGFFRYFPPTRSTHLQMHITTNLHWTSANTLDVLDADANCIHVQRFSRGVYALLNRRQVMQPLGGLNVSIDFL